MTIYLFSKFRYWLPIRPVFVPLILLFFVSFSLDTFGQSDCKSQASEAYSLTIDSSALAAISLKSDDEFFDGSFFTPALEQVLSDSLLSSRQKVQAFYFMTNKIGYSFGGALVVQEGTSYYATFLDKLRVYLSVVGDYEISTEFSDELVKLANESFDKDAIVFSNALLLLTLLDPLVAGPILETYSVYEKIKASPNVSISNHYLSICCSFVQTDSIISNLERNLSLLESEEGREDVLSALFASEESSNFQFIVDYMTQEPSSNYNSTFETGLNILQYWLHEEEFNEFLDMLVEAFPEDWRSSRAKYLIAKPGSHIYSLTEGAPSLKIWDGVGLTMCDDGFLISNGTVTEFIQN